MLVKRQASLSFMGGLFVFPGGKVDTSDGAASMLDFLPPSAGLSLHDGHGTPLGPQQVQGILVAALRELFEEVGVLLARTSDGSPVAHSPALERARSDLITGGAPFDAILRALQLRLDTAALTYWAHWITPSVESRRFDTRFFIAECPRGQTPQLELREASDMLWLTPERALDTYRGEGLPLSPPTFRTLEELAGAPHPDALRLRARARSITAILPKVCSEPLEGSTRTLLLPWDPDYAAAPGEGYPLPAAGIELGHASYGPSRMALSAGRWHSLDAPHEAVLS